ncbi:peptide ABC transporter substrate-binding protein [Spirochaeta thermophila]|uniref:Bacterial extracellular solute-binding protein, family 5 n=1 Tax=Winmispira thermophila (strain ATCC 49972 / DSM 6192 / RI 19.B1) TaxID=665571 RepID=E0RPX7_WINT6|nr:peptide ABC transporter substrate-binding protein [Spirochaeta thermophila]ADN02830.1 bacterial extracellular solute-binding protein, family 5 [Spirochaeta thermophila DSM 6192]
MKRVPVILLILSLFAPLTTAGEEARDQEFVVNILPFPSNLNPQRISTTNEAQIALALFEGLLTYHPSTLAPMPGVARKWEWNKDYTRITFYLRENARFSDGTPITAAHFRESWLYLIAHNLPYASLLDVITGARALREGKGSPEKVGIVVKDPHTLVLTLTNPAPYILKFLPHTAFAPTASGMDLSRTWAPSRDLVGNGPYRILKVEKDRLVLEKNPQYWDQESVKIPRLVITSYDDPERVMRLFNGDALHWVADGYDLSLLNNRKALVLNPLFATTFYFFNASTPPFDDPRVRRALALLVPWDELRSSDRYFFPTSHLVPQIPGYPEVEGITEPDEKTALSLLQEAGFPEGKGLPVITCYAMEGGQEEIDILTRLWRERLGLQVQVKAFTSMQAYFNAMEQDPSFHLASITWLGDFPDPLTFLSLWESGGSLNYARFSSPEYDELLREANTTQGKERYSLLARAEEFLISESAVILPIAHSPALNLVDLDWIGGWYPNPLDIHPFHTLEFLPTELGPGVVRSEEREGIPQRLLFLTRSRKE